MVIYEIALIGSLFFIAIRLKMEKEKVDTDPKHKSKWKQYFMREWDDMAFSILAGQGLAVVQESLFFTYTGWAEWEDDRAIDMYFEAEPLIAFSMGLFGSVLVMILFKYIIRKANKLTE